MAQEALAGSGEFRATASAPEQARAHLRLQGLDAGADGGLGDMQAGRGAYEIAGRRHGEKRAGELDVHVIPSLYSITR